MHLACELRRMRGDRTLRQISELAGVGQAALSQIERGLMLPKDGEVEGLERAYGHPVSDWYDVSWNDLAYMGLTVRPFEGSKPPRGYRRSNFTAGLRVTLKLLAREIEMLNGKQIVVELSVTDSDIRLDGYPRANARIWDPCIRVSFESKHGPLAYATGEFETWQDNLRAIALSLEALRSVDRYGVSKRGEQYRGWRQLGMGTDAVQTMTADEAREYMRRWDGDFTRALMDTHPDHGGDPNEVRKVLRARELIGGAA